MNKLYAPYIENIIPAGFNNILTIPFEHHPTVDSSQNYNMCIKIKDCLNDQFLTTAPIISTSVINNQASFDVADLPMRVGKYYKIFIAYYTDGEGYYSNAGILKYTALPEITLTTSNNLYVTMTYTNTDSSEYLYFVRFRLFDNAHVCLQESPNIYVNNLTMGDTISYQFYKYIDVNSIADVAYNIEVQYETVNKCRGIKSTFVNYVYSQI